MKKSLVAVVALIWIAIVPDPAFSQSGPDTCSNAYAACAAGRGITGPAPINLAQLCAAERRKCMTSGTFVGPATGRVFSGLQKK